MKRKVNVVFEQEIDDNIRIRRARSKRFLIAKYFIDLYLNVPPRIALKCESHKILREQSIKYCGGDNEKDRNS